MNAPTAPSDEGAVSEADWGREYFSSCFSPSVTAYAVPPPSSEGGLPLRRDWAKLKLFGTTSRAGGFL